MKPPLPDKCPSNVTNTSENNPLPSTSTASSCDGNFEDNGDGLTEAEMVKYLEEINNGGVSNANKLDQLTSSLSNDNRSTNSSAGPNTADSKIITLASKVKHSNKMLQDKPAKNTKNVTQNKGVKDEMINGKGTGRPDQNDSVEKVNTASKIMRGVLKCANINDNNFPKGDKPNNMADVKPECQDLKKVATVSKNMPGVLECANINENDFPKGDKPSNMADVKPECQALADGKVKRQTFSQEN